MLGGGHSAFGVELTGDAAGPKGLFDKIHTGVLSHSPNVSYWASTANPYSWQTIFAVAASNGALILNPSEAIWNIDRDVFNSLDQSEVMAVDWLDANVVIKGRKDGGVRLWDIRGRGDVHRLRHPSQINHARRLGNQSTIVVAGLDSQVLMPSAANSQIC